MLFKICPRININFDSAEFIAAFKSVFQKQLRSIFETKFSQKFNCGKAFAVNSARSALALILQTLNLPKNSEILIPNYTFFAVAKTIKECGFSPIAIDCDKNTFMFKPETIEKNITANTRVLIVEHIFGQTAEIEEITKICKKNNLILIEDCAQSIGAKHNNKFAGSFGDFAYFSFAFGKNLTTFNGGLIVVNNPNHIESLNRAYSNLRNQPLTLTLKNLCAGIAQFILMKKYFFCFTLFPFLFFLAYLNPKKLSALFLEKQSFTVDKLNNIKIYKLSNLQSALGITQLEKLEKLNNIRRKNAEKIINTLNQPQLFQQVLKQNEHTYNCLALKVKNADEFIAHIIKKGVDCRKDWMSFYNQTNVFDFEIVYIPNHPEIEIDECYINILKNALNFKN